jgi:hypothetical protein
MLILVLQRESPLLGNDLKINYETTLGARQEILNKQVYTAVIGQRLLKQTHSHGNSWSATINGVFYGVRDEML